MHSQLLDFKLADILQPEVLLTSGYGLSRTSLILLPSQNNAPLFTTQRYFIQSDKKVAICSVHPSEQAPLQCLGCVKVKILVAKSYHCSPKCFSDAWKHHHVLHERAASAVNENGNEEEIFGRFNNKTSEAANTSLSGSQSGSHVLKFECVVVDAETKLPAGHVNTILTSRVIPAPSPSPGRLISVSGVDVTGHLDLDGRISST